MPCGIDLAAEVPPAATAFVHTHPWATGEEQTSCDPTMAIPELNLVIYPDYNGKASGADQEAAKMLRIPGYILDADGITKFDERNASLQRYPRCGF